MFHDVAHLYIETPWNIKCDIIDNPCWLRFPGQRTSPASHMPPFQILCISILSDGPRQLQILSIIAGFGHHDQCTFASGIWLPHVHVQAVQNQRSNQHTDRENLPHLKRSLHVNKVYSKIVCIMWIEYSDFAATLQHYTSCSSTSYHSLTRHFTIHNLGSFTDGNKACCSTSVVSASSNSSYSCKPTKAVR